MTFPTMWKAFSITTIFTNFSQNIVSMCVCSKLCKVTSDADAMPSSWSTRIGVKEARERSSIFYIKVNEENIRSDLHSGDSDAVFQEECVAPIDAATGESETNASVLRRSVQFAKCLQRFGAQPGDVVALGGNNHLDLHIPYYAALMIGMTVGGVDPQFKYTEIKKHFKICSPKIAFCQKECLEDYLEAIKNLDLNTKLICFDDAEYSMKRFIQEYEDSDDDPDFMVPDFDLDQTYCWLLSTGGTTGAIKLAAFKHRTFFKRMAELKEMFQRFPTGSSENKQNGTFLPTLHLAPVQWISAFFGNVTYPAMQLTKVMTSAPATTEHVIDIINKYKPFTALLGPSLITGILKSEKECDLSCFASITLLGSKIQKETHLQLRERMRPGAQVSEAYGQTENLGPILSPNPSGPLGNCGNCRFQWQKNIILVDPETGKEIKESNVPGEMWTKISGFTEYYNNPEETASAFTDDGWYKTGDLLYRDEEGNYYFVERLKMLIKYRNYHVIPPEVEAVILEHPGVLDVSVTSIPHEEDGEHAVACVVRKTGCNVTAQEIKDIVANKLSDTSNLRGGVVFIDEIPLTSTGKIARGKLKKMVLTAHRE